MYELKLFHKKQLPDLIKDHFSKYLILYISTPTLSSEVKKLKFLSIFKVKVRFNNTSKFASLSGEKYKINSRLIKHGENYTLTIYPTFAISALTNSFLLTKRFPFNLRLL